MSHFNAYPIHVCYGGNKMSPRPSQMTPIWTIMTTATPTSSNVPASGTGGNVPVPGTGSLVLVIGAAPPLSEIEIVVSLVPGNCTRGPKLEIGALVMSNLSGAEVSGVGLEKVIAAPWLACL